MRQRTDRFLGGAAFSYVQLLCVTAVGLWLTPFLLRKLGQRDLGLWVAATQILGYLALLDLGVAALLPREVAIITGDTSRESRTARLVHLLRASFGAATVQAAVAAIAAVGLVWSVGGHTPGLGPPLALALAAFVLLFPPRLFVGVLQGLQDLAYVGRIQLLAWAGGTGVSVLLVLMGWRLFALATGWAVGQAIAAIGCYLRVRTLEPEATDALSTPAGWSSVVGRISAGAWVSVGQVAQVLVAGSDALVVATVAGPAAVVPLSCTSKLAAVLNNHPYVLVHTAAPALAELRVSAPAAHVLDVCMALSRSVLVLSGGLACIILVANPTFVRLWVGPEQYAGTSITVAVVALMMARHLNVTIAQLLFCFGHEKRLAITGLLDGLVGVTGMWLAVPRFGLVAAPLAQLAAVCVVSLPYHSYLLGRTLGPGSARMYLASIAGWFWRGAVPLAAGGAWVIVGPTGSIGGTAGVLVAIGAGYLLFMLPLLRQDPLRRYVERLLTIGRSALAWRPAGAGGL